MANRLSSHMDGATTLVDDQMNSDDTSMSLPLKVPISVQTYYEKICKNAPLARRNIIVDKLWLASARYSDENHELVVAEVKHLRGNDISHRLEYLAIERNLHSPTRSSSSSSAKHIVSQCSSANGDRYGNFSLKVNFDTSSDSDVCSLEELFRLITIISNSSNLYCTDIDACSWFASTIIETARAIFPSYDRESGWFKRKCQTLLKSILYKPQSECGRQIVAAYKADKKKNPNPTPQTNSQSVVSNAPSGNETEDSEA